MASDCSGQSSAVIAREAQRTEVVSLDILLKTNISTKIELELGIITNLVLQVEGVLPDVDTNDGLADYIKYELKPTRSYGLTNR